MNININQFLVFIILFVVGFYPSCARPAPYLRPKTNTDTINTDCCDDEINDKLFAKPLYDTPSTSPNTDNLLYIPFTEMTIREFGIQNYVVNRNIKTIMNYNTDTHMINMIAKSLNQSTFEIKRLVMMNIDEFNAMAEDEFISNFMDFWVAYRLIQLSDYNFNNLNVLSNIFNFLLAHTVHIEL